MIILVSYLNMDVLHLSNSGTRHSLHTYRTVVFRKFMTNNFPQLGVHNDRSFSYLIMNSLALFDALDAFDVGSENEWIWVLFRFTTLLLLFSASALFFVL